MTEPRSVVRYYCTAGNGMEAFLIDEVKTKLAAEDVSVTVATCEHQELRNELWSPRQRRVGLEDF